MFLMLIVNVRWGHPCSAPIEIRIRDERHFQRIDDYRTGIRVVGQSFQLNAIQPLMSVSNGNPQYAQENARLIAISSDTRWQLFVTREANFGYSVIHYLYDSLSDQRYHLLNVQAAAFSADNRCLMVKSTASQPALTSIITIYDLQTMLPLYRQQGDPSHYEYAWYEGR
jgi:hypothetical protein